MLTASKKNKAVSITFSSTNFKSGQVIVAIVLDETNTSIPASPITLTAIGTTGLYAASFTPTTVGTYKIIIQETGVNVGATSIEIENYDLDSVITAINNIPSGGGSSGGYIP